MYDLIIIGMGISGLTAGIYAKRKNMNVLMIDKMMLGGLLNSIDKVSNYPGLPDITGSEFVSNLKHQVESLEIPYVYEEVISLNLEKEIKEIRTSNNVYKARKIILAAGRSPKYLGLAQEEKLIGRGISTCAVCDGFFYRNKDIALVGTGDSALQEALYLANLVNHLYILGRSDKLRGSEALIKEVREKKNIEILMNTQIKKYNLSEDKLESLTLNDDTKLKVDGVFMYIGFKPNTENLPDKIKDSEGYIKVNEKLETSIKGVYAIGDIIKKDTYQLISAASDGARAIVNME